MFCFAQFTATPILSLIPWYPIISQHFIGYRFCESPCFSPKSRFSSVFPTRPKFPRFFQPPHRRPPLQADHRRAPVGRGTASGANVWKLVKNTENSMEKIWKISKSGVKTWTSVAKMWKCSIFTSTTKNNSLCSDFKQSPKNGLICSLLRLLSFLGQTGVDLQPAIHWSCPTSHPFFGRPSSFWPIPNNQPSIILQQMNTWR